MSVQDYGSNGANISNGERSVIDFLTSVFNVDEGQAIHSYMKLKTYIFGDRETAAMMEAANNQSLDNDYDAVFERTRSRAVGWDIGAIVRQVVMPLVGGYAGYFLAGAFGLTGIGPVVVGVLVAVVILVKNRKGTQEMLKAKMDSALEDIYSPTKSLF